MTSSLRERLIDRLQVAVPLVQRLAVVSQQQHTDATNATAALVEMIAILRQPSVPFDHPAERTVSDLGLALTRRGLTAAEASHLAGIPEPRLRHLLAGATPTPEERLALLGCLPEWRP